MVMLLLVHCSLTAWKPPSSSCLLQPACGLTTEMEYMRKKAVGIMVQVTTEKPSFSSYMMMVLKLLPSDQESFNEHYR
jgi:hypothetical protein